MASSSSSSSPSLTLTYFDARSKGEAIRLAMHIGSVPFTDHRIIRSTEWPTLKPTMPFQQLPILTIKQEQPAQGETPAKELTTVIAQSNAILRYVGTLAGLYPAQDVLAAAQVDQIVMHLCDIRNLYSTTKKDQDSATRTAARAVLAATVYPTMLAALDKTIAANSAGTWCVGTSITVADLVLYVVVLLIKSGDWKGVPCSLVDVYPRIITVFDAVSKHPKVVEWEAAHSM
ncbi:hypothetical protein BASA62_000302 [Batrachochytrium salamandrivorans]|nr:hypothetical protein BASA62_000302 [Batrachochytrium salamandrivorans]